MQFDERDTHEEPSRRKAMKQMLLGGLGTAAGVAGFTSYEEACLAQQQGVGKEVKPNMKPTGKAVDGVSGATRTSFDLPAKAKLKEKIPLSQIGNVKLSRMILGGNLIGGWAHARDLIYVSDLIKAYHTKNKVFETFYLAEECGINAFLGHYSLFNMVTDYWKWTDGKMQFIGDCASSNPDVFKQVVDGGAAACYLNGEIVDRIVRQQKYDDFEKAFDYLRNCGIPFGLGTHRVECLQEMVKRGYIPQFWMKTYHDHNYWSVKNTTSEHDNVFCRRPDDTKAFMESRPEPWIAFKVLAAGAIRPEHGFKYAFEGGADFICVGMYDFQMVNDVNICSGILKSKLNRKRPWCTPNVDRAQYEKELEEAAEAEEENA